MRRVNPAARFAFAYPTAPGARFRGSIVGGTAYASLEDARRRAKRLSAKRRRSLVIRDLETEREYPTEAPRENPRGRKRRRSSSSTHRTVKHHLTHAGIALLDRRLGTSILHAGRAVKHAVRRVNPPLPVRTFTGKSGHLVSEHVLALDYRHASSAQRTPYRHDFGSGVELWALRDGSLLLRGGHGQRLWEDFYVKDDE